jgi:hypothetical protein
MMVVGLLGAFLRVIGFDETGGRIVSEKGWEEYQNF